MSLEKKNSHPRDSNIRFVDETHTYYVNGSSDGYISTTTLVHSLFEKFDADNVIKKMRSSRRWKFSPYFRMTDDEIKKQWDNNRDFAANAGTEMHENLERFYNNEEHETDTKEFELFQMYLDDHSTLEPYRSEWVIYDEICKVSGSVDMVYSDPLNPGSFIIADWKRSKEIKTENRWATGVNKVTEHLEDCNFIHYSLQLSIYKYILEKNYGVKITECFIVVLHPKQDNYIKMNIMNLDDEVLRIMEQRSGKKRIVEQMSGKKESGFIMSKIKF